MKKLAIIAIIAGTATASVAGFAIAQPHRGGHGEMLQTLDANGDGQITRAETESAKAQKFAEADTNGDGGLSMAEIEAFRAAERESRKEAMKQKMFQRADKDGNGVISADEFEARGAPFFERIDANGDDVITADEIEAMKEKRGHRGKRGWGGPDGDPDQ